MMIRQSNVSIVMRHNWDSRRDRFDLGTCLHILSNQTVQNLCFPFRIASVVIPVLISGKTTAKETTSQLNERRSSTLLTPFDEKNAHPDSSSYTETNVHLLGMMLEFLHCLFQRIHFKPNMKSKLTVYFLEHGRFLFLFRKAKQLED